MLNKPVPPRLRASTFKTGSQPDAGETVAASTLGDDITISGNIHADTDLQVDGRVEGDISCASLVQSEGSEVVGAIAADTVRIAGRVHGSVTARDVVILKSARVHGDIVYDSLVIEQGARLDGRLTPSDVQPQILAPTANDIIPPLTLATAHHF